MTSLVEKKAELVDDLASKPTDVINSRIDVVKNIQLYNETLTTLATSLSTDYGSGRNLPKVAYELAKIRANCLGANTNNIMYHDLGEPTDYTASSNFTFPTLNGGIGSKPHFGVLLKDPGNEYVITLSNTSGSTATSTESNGTSNTYSNFVGDYYFVRSRATGELIDIIANTTPFINPSVDMPLGNNVTFGDSIADETGNWNELFVFANIGLVEFTSTSDQYLTLEHTLGQGSDSTTVLPPPVGNFYGVKRHNTDYRFLTITANSTIDVISNLPGNTIFSSNASMITMGDELSSSSWNSNLTVVAVDSENNNIILSNNVEEAFTDLTITSKQVIEGREAHTLFGIAQIVTEGMVPNSNWKHIGDDDGVYSATNETFGEATLYTKTTFETALGNLLPENAQESSTPIVFKGGSGLQSSSQSSSTNPDSYPNKERNPLKPAIEGARNASSEGGLQPSGLGMNDIFVGRFVKYEEDRKDNSGDNIGDYRYMVDSAGKFFYLVDPITAAHNTNVVPTSLPYSTSNTDRGIEPEKKFANDTETVLTLSIGRVRDALQAIRDVAGSANTVSSTSDTSPGQIPSGFDGSYYVNSSATMTFTWGTPASASRTYNNLQSTTTNKTIYAKSGTGTYTLGDIIYTHQFTFTQTTNDNGENPDTYTIERDYTITETTHAWNDLMHMKNGDTNNGLVAGDYDFVKSKIVTLNGLKSFRDPIVEDSNGAEYDADKESAAQDFENAIGAAKQDIDDLEAHFNDIDDNPSGDFINTDDVLPLKATLDTASTQITARITEINSRIGMPTYSGTQASNGAEPGITVTALPAKSSTSLVPYGRTIYEAVNICLGNDLGLVQNTMDDASALDFQYKQIRDKRNAYDLLNGRGKFYAS
tara:strand:+ start:166 stop:2796 length:2631 start_codon:yes stop_codon:yes gene_type:complete